MRRYQNFDLELFDYRREAGEERFRLRVARAPDGSQMALGEAQALGLPAGLRARLQPLEAPGLGRPAVIALGLELGDLLLPPGPARQLFERSLVALGEDEGLRLRLLIEAPELASLPWELAYLDLPNVPAAERDARGFLVLRRPLSLARHEVLAAPAGEFSPVAAPRLLCLLSAAKGAGLAPLDLAAERQGVEQALEGSRISVESPERATLSALQQGLAGGAQLFHYAGHGEFAAEMGEIPRTREGKGFLLLEDEAGQPLDVAAEQLGLNLAGAGVRLALLNGCETGRRDPAHAWSGIAPLLAQAGIPAVLAHQFRIADDAAIELAGSFYRSLAGGEPVDAAVAEARLALANRPGAGARDFATPVLYLRLGEDSDGVLLPSAAAEPPSTAEPRPNRWFWLNLALLAALVAAAGNPNITDQLLKGVKLGDREYKNHLDGYNQLDLITGAGPSKRHELFYFGGPHLGAIRIDDFKYQFFQQPQGWPGPKVTTDMPLIINLRQDPFERTPSIAGAPPQYCLWAAR